MIDFLHKSVERGVTIPGSRKLERLDENNGAENIDLSADDLGEIRSAMEKIIVVGDRY